MRFTKMQGAGNDYVYVDCFAQRVPENLPELARRIADRIITIHDGEITKDCRVEAFF